LVFCHKLTAMSVLLSDSLITLNTINLLTKTRYYTEKTYGDNGRYHALRSRPQPPTAAAQLVVALRY